MVKNKNTISLYLTRFLTNHLQLTLNVSANTISSYRDTYKLFLIYWQSVKKVRPEHLCLNMITHQSVLDFLYWLENDRGCSVSTRNQRLAALHSFIRYVQIECLDNLYELHKILSIPS